MKFIENLEKKGINSTIKDVLEVQKNIQNILEYCMGIENCKEYDLNYLINEHSIEFEVTIQKEDIDRNYFFEILDNIFNSDKCRGSYHYHFNNKSESFTYSLSY